ncbi:MAG TPA: hypothetical protein VK158_00640 [Acidobacteriota bacterium]|nr:hypothetical protein [Acidobacteriota bacterium]
MAEKIDYVAYVKTALGNQRGLHPLLYKHIIEQTVTNGRGVNPSYIPLIGVCELSQLLDQFERKPVLKATPKCSDLVGIMELAKIHLVSYSAFHR